MEKIPFQLSGQTGSNDFGSPRIPAKLRSRVVPVAFCDNSPEIPRKWNHFCIILNPGVNTRADHLFPPGRAALSAVSEDVNNPPLMAVAPGVWMLRVGTDRPLLTNPGSNPLYRQNKT